MGFDPITVGALVAMAAGTAFSAVEQRKGRKAAQKMRPTEQAPLAQQSDDSAENARRDAQRAAAKKKGLQASILAGETGGGPLGAKKQSGGF